VCRDLAALISISSAALLAANGAGIIAASNETPVDILRADIGQSSCFLL
jgi:hypothetical protein